MRRSLVAAMLCVLALASSANAQRLVPSKDAAHPRLKFADSLASVNDRCVVTYNRLNPAIAPVYINGKPVGFC